MIVICVSTKVAIRGFSGRFIHFTSRNRYLQKVFARIIHISAAINYRSGSVTNARRWFWNINFPFNTLSWLTGNTKLVTGFAHSGTKQYTNQKHMHRHFGNIAEFLRLLRVTVV